MQSARTAGTALDPSQLLERAVEWAIAQGQRILSEGEPLDGVALDAGRWLGIRRPEALRILIVDQVPRPTDPVLLAACDRAGMPRDPSGMCLGRGVFIRRASTGDPELIPHELVHAHQYERLGGIRPFLTRYLWEMDTLKYHEAPLEKEARDRASEFLRRER